MKTLLLILISLSVLSCQSVPPPEPLTHKNSNLTHGNVQMHIVTGVTTKAQILEVFGAPKSLLEMGKDKKFGPTKGKHRSIKPTISQQVGSSYSQDTPAQQVALNPLPE